MLSHACLNMVATLICFVLLQTKAQQLSQTITFQTIWRTNRGVVEEKNSKQGCKITTYGSYDMLLQGGFKVK